MVTTSSDVIVIGAGAAGLAAARSLASSRHPLRVVILEARDRPGGRIWTRPRGDTGVAIDLGAAFVHGGNESLWKIVREAGLVATPAPERHWIMHERRCLAIPDISERLDRVLGTIGPRTRGDFASWWRRHARDHDPLDRLLVREHVTDFNAAPVDEMSVSTLFASTRLPEERQSCLSNSFTDLVTALHDRLPSERVEMRLGDPVVHVAWSLQRVTVTTRHGSRHRARALLVTLPLGVLQASPPAPGAIRFEPELPGRRALWRQLQFGHSLRIVLHLQPDAWNRPVIPEAMRGDGGRRFGFLHADRGAFSVWWSSPPAPLLTGWVGGPAAWSLTRRRDHEIFRLALDSLATVLHCTGSELAELIIAWHLHNWTADPYARGAYSFSQAGFEDAPRRLARPVHHTIFFAGEATAEVPELGTVHGALASGERAARQIRQRLAARRCSSLAARH